MGILIGMDEAGYGPNLGPLVVAATAWDVPEELSVVGCRVSEDGEPAGDGVTSTGGRNGVAVAQLPRRPAVRGHRPKGGPQSEIGEPRSDLYWVLRKVVAKRASERRVAIADSKTLYQPGAGLRQLERGVLAVLLSMQQSLKCWSALVQSCRADPDGNHRRCCWPEAFDCPLPADAAPDELASLSERFARACDACGVHPIAMRARLVYPAQFNDLVAHFGTKGAVLSHVTMGLLREVIEGLSPSAKAGSPSKPPVPSSRPPIYAVCDKHGARNYYTALLQHHFSEHWIEPLVESHAESRYEWGPPESRTRVIFRLNGETFLPAALASMTAKYLRELAMRAFNEFWSGHVPGLRPTAGYPTDARRFRKDIAHAQRRLGIDDHVLWRNR